MRFLTYHPYRRRVWTEHEHFPHKAVQYFREARFESVEDMEIYTMSDDRKEVNYIPRDEWVIWEEM